VIEALIVYCLGNAGNVTAGLAVLGFASSVAMSHLTRKRS
jgi:hypothetical protein